MRSEAMMKQVENLQTLSCGLPVFCSVRACLQAYLNERGGKLRNSFSSYNSLKSSNLMACPGHGLSLASQNRGPGQSCQKSYNWLGLTRPILAAHGLKPGRPAAGLSGAPLKLNSQLLTCIASRMATQRDVEYNQIFGTRA